MDDELVVATDNNTIAGYKISEGGNKSFTIKIPEKINMIRIDYLTKMLLVSCDKKILVVNKDTV